MTNCGRPETHETQQQCAIAPRTSYIDKRTKQMNDPESLLIRKQESGSVRKRRPQPRPLSAHQDCRGN